MPYRLTGRFYETDTAKPTASAICDRCGFRFNIDKMVWQFDYRGTTRPINTRILVCGRASCLDVPQPQNSPVILTPDPPAVLNARPEPYTLDEASWLGTEDGDTITTQDGDLTSTPLPNPEDNAATAHLRSQVRYPSGSVATVYLDIFNGNPLSSGVSVLEDITGSATRTDIAAELTTVSNIAENQDVIVIAAESAATTNVSYVALYSAATGGTLLASASVSVNGPSVTVGNPVVFSALDLTINIT